MELLRENQKGGWLTYVPYYLQYDYYMRNLFGYPPFEEFVKVKG